jgi:hypothetical protein
MDEESHVKILIMCGYRNLGNGILIFRLLIFVIGAPEFMRFLHKAYEQWETSPFILVFKLLTPCDRFQQNLFTRLVHPL